MMMKDFEHIVKDTFEHFEADVNPQVWMNVQQGIKTAPPTMQGHTGNAATSLSKVTGIFTNMVGLISVATVAILAIAGTLYYLSDSPDTAKPAVVKPTIIAPQTDILTENINVKPVTDENTILPLNQDREKPVISKQTVETSYSAAKKDNARNNRLNGDQESKPTSGHNVTLIDIVKPDNQTAVGTHKIDESTGKETFNKANPDNQVKALINSYQSQPIAYIMANPVSGNAPLKVQFINNGYAKSVSWDFGQTTSTNNQTAYIFQTPGTYTVKLSALDENNRVYTDEVIIEVKGSETTLQSSVSEIQNVFTPNGDGYNDLFRIKGSNLSSVNAVIYNVSGKQIYHWTDPEAGWDGKLSGGSGAPEGIYFYIIEARGKDGKEFLFKGSVRLIH